MDRRLVAWARAVKARRPAAANGLVAPPPLWLFTDAVRVPDPAAAAAALPAGLCGIVFRHDGAPDRSAILRRLATVCRARRLVLVVAGPRQSTPAGVGRHLRSAAGLGRHFWSTAGLGRHLRSTTGVGRHLKSTAGLRARSGLTTSSAHGIADLVKARRAGAQLAFLSPVFDTLSHPGTAPLGPVRWSRMARSARIHVLALGGVTGRNVRRLPRWTAGAGAIGALSP